VGVALLVKMDGLIIIEEVMRRAVVGSVSVSDSATPMSGTEADAGDG
jgi:hypothetical protein